MKACLLTIALVFLVWTLPGCDQDPADGGGGDDETAADDDDSATDDDDSAADDDDDATDDDDTATDDDDSASSGLWQLCASAGSTPSDDGWSEMVSAPAGAFADGDSTENGSGSSPPSLGITDPSWGLWADPGGNASASIGLDGAGPLAPGNSMSIEFDNGDVDTGARVGIRWLLGTTVLATFSFTGGNSVYQATDANGTADLTATFSTDGMRVNLTQDTSGNYRLSVDRGPERTGLYVGGHLAPDAIEVFNEGAGVGPKVRDLYFNCLTVTR